MTIQKFLQSLLSFTGELPIEMYGKLYFVYLRDLHDLDALRDNCIKDVYRVRDFIKPGMTVVDIGAHIGTFSLAAAARVGEKGKVFSFEPEKSNYRSLVRNIEKNNLSHVQSFNTAISDHSGEQDFYLSADSEGHSLINSNGPVLKTVKVRVAMLDELSFGKVDILKIDNEGSEISALRGGREFLENNRQLTLIIEDSATTSRTEIVSYLSELGFSCHSFNYFIVAKRK